MWLIAVGSMIVFGSAHPNVMPGAPTQKHQQHAHSHNEATDDNHGHGHAHAANPDQLLQKEGIAKEMDHIQEHLKIQKDLHSVTVEESEFSYFTYVDLDHSGTLDGLELIKTMTHYHDNEPGASYSDAELAAAVDAILATSDLDGDGYISYQEFKARLLSGKAQTMQLQDGLVINY